MQSINQPTVEHSIQSAGVDWITASAQKGSTRWNMQEYADHERRRLMDIEEPIKMGYRQGYYGWGCEGFFHGNREGGSIIIASGAVAHNVFRSVTNVADHISRLDLQVTVNTEKDRPHLGVQAYSALCSNSPSKVRVKNVQIIKSSPQGETCNIGKRRSDTYGRIYDKATEAKLGEPRSLWRYEVEYKRVPANHMASCLLRAEAPEAMARGVVHAWYDARGVVPIFTPDPLFCTQKPAPSPPSRNLLTWFEESLSITIARAVGRYGLEQVLESLGLAKQVEAMQERREDVSSGH